MLTKFKKKIKSIVQAEIQKKKKIKKSTITTIGSEGRKYLETQNHVERI